MFPQYLKLLLSLFCIMPDSKMWNSAEMLTFKLEKKNALNKIPLHQRSSSMNKFKTNKSSKPWYKCKYSSWTFLNKTVHFSIRICYKHSPSLLMSQTAWYHEFRQGINHFSTLSSFYFTIFHSYKLYLLTT